MTPHERATVASLGLLRIWVFGIWMIQVSLDPIERLTELPEGLFNPPVPVGLLPSDMTDDLLQRPLLLGFRMLLAVGLAIVVVGAYRRPLVPPSWSPACWSTRDWFARSRT